MLQAANTACALLLVFGERKHLPENSTDSITPVLLAKPARRLNNQRVVVDPESVVCETLAPPVLAQLLFPLFEKVVFEGSPGFGRGATVAVVEALFVPPRWSSASRMTVKVPAAL